MTNIYIHERMSLVGLGDDSVLTIHFGRVYGSSTYTHFPAAVPNGQMTQYQETTKLSTRKERAEDIYDKHISSQNPLAIVLIAAI